MTKRPNPYLPRAGAPAKPPSQAPADRLEALEQLVAQHLQRLTALEAEVAAGRQQLAAVQAMETEARALYEKLRRKPLLAALFR